MATSRRRASRAGVAGDRRKVTDRYGTALARKASDELLRSLARSRPRFAAAEALGTAGAASAVLEFGAGSPVTEAAVPEVAGLHPTVRRLTSEAARWAAINQRREQFHRDSSAIRADLEKRAATRAVVEGMMPGAMRGAVQLSWLIRAVRAPLNPKALALAAEAREVEHIDLPRQLRPDIDRTAIVVGAPTLRRDQHVGPIDVVVAVIDSEIDIDHPALRGHATRAENYTLEPWGSPDAHGTAVAGIISSTDNRFAGMAPGARIRNYKVLATRDDLTGDDFAGALALQRALEDGARIANCSWGAGPTHDGTSREARACDAAWDLGLTIVKSAGNRGPGSDTMTTPADARGVIVVAATTTDGTRVPDYSSRGPAANSRRPDLAAPGGQLDDQIRSCLAGTKKCGDCGAGTSFAAPHVSGLLAVLLQAQPDLAPDQLRALLLAACRPLDGVPADAQGSGLVSF